MWLTLSNAANNQVSWHWKLSTQFGIYGRWLVTLMEGFQWNGEVKSNCSVLREVCNAKSGKSKYKKKLSVKRKKWDSSWRQMWVEGVLFSKKGDIVPYSHAYAKAPRGGINCYYRIEKGQFQEQGLENIRRWDWVQWVEGLAYTGPETEHSLQHSLQGGGYAV